MKDIRAELLEMNVGSAATYKRLAEAVKVYQAGQEQVAAAKRELQQVMQDAHADGCSADVLVEVTGYSRQWVFNMLDRHGKRIKRKQGC